MWKYTKIPQHAYFYWGDLNDLPWIRFLTLQTFRYHNPEWEMTLLVSKYDYDNLNKIKKLNVNVTNTDVQAISGIDLSTIPDKYVQDICRSDILRWYLLYEYGGAWVDMDILFIKSMDNIVNGNPAMLSTGFLPTPYNNFFITKPQAEALKDLWHAAREIPVEKMIEDQFSTGPVNYEKIVAKSNYPYLEFLPLTTMEIADSDGKNFEFDVDLNIQPETVGVHWHGSGISKKYKEVTKKNCSYHPSMIARLVAYSLYLMK